MRHEITYNSEEGLKTLIATDDEITEITDFWVIIRNTSGNVLLIPVCNVYKICVIKENEEGDDHKDDIR